jgi:AraC family transcriptional regulator
MFAISEARRRRGEPELDDAGVRDSAICLADRETGAAFATATGAAVMLASSSHAGWRSPLIFEIHRMPPGAYDPHTTIGHQLMMNLGGPVRFGWLDRNRRREAWLETGQLCIQSDGDSNAPRWHDELTFATAAIDPSVIDSLLGDRAPARGELFPKRHCVPDARGAQLARALAAELTSPTEPLYAETLSAAFVLHLVEAHGRTRGRKQLTPRGKLGAGQLRAATELVREQLGSVTVQAMARAAGYSQFQFARLFKATTGWAPHQFVRSLRLERASRLLREPDASVAHVALATGFYDQAHLTNAFRDAFGLTPAVFAARS